MPAQPLTKASANVHRLRTSPADTKADVATLTSLVAELKDEVAAQHDTIEQATQKIELLTLGYNCLMETVGHLSEERDILREHMAYLSEQHYAPLDVTHLQHLLTQGH